jgi:hypothetical protein
MNCSAQPNKSPARFSNIGLHNHNKQEEKDMRIVSKGLCLVMVVLAAGPWLPAAGQSPTLAGAAFYGGANDQTGTGIAIAGANAFVSGYSDQMSLALKYTLPLGSSPAWATTWPGGPFSTPGGEGFRGVAATPGGAYFGGYSWSQTSDYIGDKEAKSVLVKYAADGPTGTGVAGELWVAKPKFFPSYDGGEAFMDAVAAFEADQTFVYAAGYAQPGWGSTAIAAKYATDGTQLWWRVLTRWHPRRTAPSVIIPHPAPQ